MNLKKKKRIIITTLFVILCSSVVVIWLYNHRVISGNYNKITIIEASETIDVITDKQRIEDIISQINQSDRDLSLPPSSGFRYDWIGEFGILRLENTSETLELFYVVPNGNVLTKYWDIDTNFNFKDQSK
jgi:hypothetical protein